MIEDVIQDAYVRLLNTGSVAQVRNSRSYFARAATSVVLTRFRRERCVSEQAHSDDYFSAICSPDPGPDAQLEAKIELEQIRLAIEGLAARQREVVLMRRLESMTGRQTAERMSISQSTVEKHLSAAMRQLTRSCEREHQ